MPGEIRVIRWTYGDRQGEYVDTDGYSDYWWTDGNGGCDCNRGTMFGLGELPCGETIQIELGQVMVLDAR